MPQPVQDDQRYLPGLDGLRAIAVAAVVAYHLGYGWAQGGLLGVGVFFTLSGYLITDILVGQWASRGRIKLGDFWLRRARRLLPALFVMLAAVTVWVTLSARTFLPGFRGNVVASVFYVSNWWYIGQHASYYARFAPAAPLDHLWSLAVEEQFYLVWPWVVLLLVLLFSRRAVRSRKARADQPGGLAAPGPGASYLSRGSRWWLAGATLALAAVSAVAMARLFHPGYDPTRVYEGTDTRAFGLLIGAALAMVYPTRGIAPGAGRSVPAAARWALDLAGLAGLAVIAALVWRTSQYSDFMFRGGLELLSVATAAVVAAAVTPGSLIGRALGVGPLRWTGVRSYGIYLWHYPLIVLTVAVGAAANPASPARAVAIVAGTVAVSAASWTLIEEPIRTGFRKRGTARQSITTDGTVKDGTVNDSTDHRGIDHEGTGYAGAGYAGAGHERAGHERAGHERAGAGSGAGSGGRARRAWRTGRAWLPESPQAVAGVCLLAAAVLAAGVSASTRLAANSTPSAGGRVNTTAAGGASGGGAQTGSGSSAQLSNTGGSGGQVTQPGQAVPANSAGVDPVAAGGSAAIVPALPTPPPQTSCTQVVHIGDSTSDGLVSANYEPNPANRIMARYANVGIRHSIMRVVGATSIVESLPGTPNAYQMASQLLKTGYHGCWVLALGTNDTADVYVGSNVGRVQRIQKMMKLIGNQPVMWVEVTSLLSSGPYAEANMQMWNDALKQELPKYPNMRIYDWPAVAQKAWFINDGIHYTSLGYAHRATAIADALAYAFPAR